MEVTSVKINPASGDSTATLFADPDAESEQIDTVDKGEVLKVTGEEGNFYTVEIKPKDENVPRGGCGPTGVCIATPYTYLYNNEKRYKSLGRVNNGTLLDIIDYNEDFGLMHVTCLTTNGRRTGYLEARYVFRNCLV